MILNTDYKLKGNFKYYEYNEIKKRLQIYDNNKEILTSEEQAFLEFGSEGIANIILKKYIDENLELDIEIIPDLNIRKEIAQIELDEIEKELKLIDREIDDYINLYNRYPHILYLYVTIEILTIVYKITNKIDNKLYA